MPCLTHTTYRPRRGTRITTGPSDSTTYNWDYHFDVCGQIVQAPGCELSSAAVRNPTAPPSLCQDLAGPGPGVYTRIGR